jgi:hypothetical protein
VKEACRNFEEMIQLYLDGRLSKEGKKTFESHLDDCLSCGTELQAFSALFSGLENMPLDEPPADFNAEVLSRIPFPAIEPVPEKRSLLGITSGVVLAVALMTLSSLGFYSIVAGSGRISYVLSNGFLKAVGVMEWLSLNSLQGVVDLVKMANDLPILSSLALLGRIFLSVASTTITDPFFALMLSGMTMIGIISSVIMARIVRPNWSRVSVNGAGTNRFLHFQ